MKFEIKKENGVLYISTPYNKTFAAKLRGMGGKWNGSMWEVPEDILDAVRTAMNICFGRDERQCALVDVEITATNWVMEGAAFGLTIAQISHRDSGAWVPKDMRDSVSILSGNIDSGGSRKSPRVEIEPGTKILIRGVPRKAVDERLDLDKDYEVKIIKEYEESLDRTTLLREREQLLSRIKEIDLLLSAEA